MFVKWSCGCIGLHGAAENVLIKPCDVDDDEMCFIHRGDLKHKSYVQLFQDDVDKLVREVDSLIADGYLMRQIRFAVKYERG